MVIAPPNNQKVILEGDKLPTLAWKTWFQSVSELSAALTMSGTTAQRPSKGLWIGRRYYDKTLLKPVYLSAVNPSVWRDGAGTIV